MLEVGPMTEVRGKCDKSESGIVGTELGRMTGLVGTELGRMTGLDVAGRCTGLW